MKKQWSFTGILVFWIAAIFLSSVLNGWLLHSWLLSSLVRAGLGVTLLLCPAYPAALERYWSPDTCRRVIRLAAFLEVVVSFAVRFAV